MNQVVPATFRLTLLGGFGLRDGGDAAVALPTRKCELLLAFLAMPAGQFHSRDKLAGLLWGASGADQASGSLRKALSALRQVLGPASLLNDRDAVALAPGVIVSDADDLAHMAAAPEATQWRDFGYGELLDGKPSTSAEFGEWLSFERTRCRNHALTVLNAKATALLAQGRHAEALGLARRLTALDNLREESHRLVMRALIAAGERPAALTHFNEVQALLRRELGVDPSPATLALKRDIARPEQAAGPPLAEPVPAGRFAHHVSIAVLPFANIGGPADQDAVAEGLSEDIITELSRRRDLMVMARQSSFPLAGGPPRDVASALGVRYVLSGGLRRAGGRLRITAQLTDGADGRMVWAERYDRPDSGLFEVQDDVVNRILAAVDAQWRQAERDRALRQPPSNLDAWEAVHRGLWHMYRFTAADTDLAEQQFNRAAGLAPEFALARAGLAYAAFVRITWHFTADVQASLAHGIAHAEAAVALDRDGAFGHVVLGRLLTLAGDSGRAIGHLETAVDINPSFAQGHFGLAQAWFWRGDPVRALGHVDTALILNPRDPLASMFMTLSAFCHYWLGDPARAEQVARKAVGLEARETWSRLALAAALVEQGCEAEARQAVAEALALDPRLTLKSFDAIVGKTPAELRDRVYKALRTAGL